MSDMVFITLNQYGYKCPYCGINLTEMSEEDSILHKIICHNSLNDRCEVSLCHATKQQGPVLLPLKIGG